MLHISLFSGIGGFDLAAEWMGWTNIVSCEINDFGNKVLAHYWPNSYHHRDVKTLTLEKINKELGENWRTDDVILTGGFPCQPYSSAGKRKGKEDERHLWREMLRVIREIKPSYIVGENVAGLLSWSGGLVFDEVHSDLEASGYQVQAVVIPAAAVNAPHGRDRVWFVARNSKSNGNAKVEQVFERKDTNTIGVCNYDASNPNDDGGQKQCRDMGQENEKIQRKWNDSFFNATKYNGNERSAAHSNNPRTDIGMPSKREWEKGDSIGRFTQSESWQTGRDGDAADTNAKRFQGTGGNGIQEMERSSQQWNNKSSRCNKRNYWSNFPTVSPVHIGNDGLSNRLDGITFSKWRKESIKAAGNAVVPQVVYEIFKAIEATRK